jgi:anti-sigma factor RsiW
LPVGVLAYSFQHLLRLAKSINGSITMDMHKRDRFELLNDYLDGEVTAAQRRQIEGWLTTDSTVQRLYARALELRQKWQIMSPLAQHLTESEVKQIFSCRKTKPKRAVLWEAIVLAAVLLGALSGVLPERQSPVLPMAQAPQLTVKPEPWY